MIKSIFIRFVFLVFLLFIKCKRTDNVVSTDVKNIYPSILPSQILSKNPTVISLKKEKVQKIEIPTKHTPNTFVKTKDGPKLADLLPPFTYNPNGGLSGGLSHFNTYSTEQGLSLSSIACGLLDRKGNLWFGTYGGGVNKYDGKSFTVYNSSHGLANNLVLCITEDCYGNIWFGTQGGGVSKYDGKSFTTLNILNGLSDNVVYSIVEDNNQNLWFGTKDGGVCKYENNPKTDSLLKNSLEKNTKINVFKSFGYSDGLGGNTIRSILKDRNGNLWFASEHDGISKYDGNKFIVYNTTNGLVSNTIWSMAEDNNGDFWFGTNGDGVSRFDGKSFYTYSTKNGLANNTIWAITKDKKGNLWFGSEGGGVSVISIENQKKITSYKIKEDSSKLFTTYNTFHGLSNNVVFSITEDNTGNLWFGTYGGGVCRFNGNSFVTFNAKQGLASNTVFSITEDKDKNLWFGSYGGGVTKYNGKTFVVYSKSQGLPNNTIWAITKDSKNNLWFATHGDGVSKYDGNSFTNYNSSNGLNHNTIRCIKEDKFGNLWFGSEGGGVIKFDGEFFTNYKTEQGLTSNTIRTIYIDKKGNLWFGSEGSGISKFDGKYFTNYNTSNGLINNVVRSMCEDENGNIWFGTQAGLSCLIINEKTSKFINYTSENGLPDNYVTQILSFKKNKMIVGTNNGICIFSPNASLKSNTKLIDLELFNVNTNYPIKDVNVGQNAIYVDSKGIIWVGTGDDKTSLARIDYDLIEKKSINLRPEILSIKINQQKLDWYSLFDNSFNKSYLDSITLIQQQQFIYGKTLSKSELDSVRDLYSGINFTSISRFYSKPLGLVLPHKQNNITIEFNANELCQNSAIKYKYILEGYDKDWSPEMNKNEATFGNINEGEYVFKVKAKSSTGKWSEPTIFKFKVLPPFYRTYLAYVLYILCVVFVFRGFFKWRIATFKKKQFELEEIVKQRTAEVIQQKEEAEYQKELVQEKQKEIVDSINYAKRIQDALLSQDDCLNKNLPHHFVLFKPKDIVSGDFYWSTEYNNKFYLAVCDSTGHGVPGAFMSLLNIGFLNEAIREKNIIEPHKILNYVRQRLIESISKEGQKDGMDGILISIPLNELSLNRESIVLEYAAANNSPILIHNAILSELPKDKMPIGKAENLSSFKTHQIELHKNATLYLYTDGFADQFGGEKGKKFKRKNLNELLISLSDKDMLNQRSGLEEQFTNWKGNLEQVDDVSIIGIKI